MSTAYVNPNLRSSDSQIQNVRLRTKITTLMSHLNEFKSKNSEIRKIKKEIGTLIGNYSFTIKKRDKLMEQNFSSAPHLKKTHAKYWLQKTEFFQKIEKNVCLLKFKEKELKILKNQLPILKDQITNASNSEIY